VQAVDFRDDHGLGGLPLRGVGRQVTGCFFGVLQPHGDVEPVERRRRGDAGINQDRAQPGTAIGEGSQFGLVGVADFLEAASDQRLDRRIGLCDRSKNLSGSVKCFDVAETDFEMPLAIPMAPDEG
jgi:hypothetical protein